MFKEGDRNHRPITANIVLGLNNHVLNSTVVFTTYFKLQRLGYSELKSITMVQKPSWRFFYLKVYGGGSLNEYRLEDYLCTNTVLL